MACQRLGLGQVDTERMTKHLEGLRELHQENRMKAIGIEIDALYALLDGVAEEEAGISIPTDNDHADMMEQYIQKHGEACIRNARSWVQVAKGKSKMHTPTGKRGITDAYEALPVLASPPMVVARTLQEQTTKAEYDKALRALTNQRGRIHAYPPIQATVWPTGESTEVVECREERIKRLSKYDSTVFLSKVIKIMDIKKPTVVAATSGDDPYVE